MIKNYVRTLALLCGLLTISTHAQSREDQLMPSHDPNLHGDFKNPGGMWMPNQIPAQAELLRKLGLELDPKELSDPSSNLLQSIVSLGGCSGSFVSKDGLIITNHHCVQSILSYLSQQNRAKGGEADFVKTGYVARTRGEELSAGPAREIFITTRFVEVTDQVRAGVDQIADPVARAKHVESRVKEIVRRAEEGSDDIRAEVASYFRQEKYFLIEKLRIRDVRLVYAPPEAVGFFGGDEHNWHWPRFTGDFALLRPYVAPEGKPAAYHEDNVPYRTKRHFQISRRGLALRELALVAGYPGRTERLSTGHEFEDSVKTDIVEGIANNTRFKKIFDDLAARDKGLEIKTASSRFGLANVIKNRESSLDAIHGRKIVDVRLEFDRQLQSWIESSPERQNEFGTALRDLNALHEKFKDPEAAKRTFDLWRVPIFGRAMTIVRKTQQATLADPDRDESFQKRNWEILRNTDTQAQGTLDARIDTELFLAVFRRLLDLPRAEQPAALDALFGADRTAVTDEQIRAKVAELTERTKLYDLETRQSLLIAAESGQLPAATLEDPVMSLASALLPFALKQIDKGRAQAGEYMQVAFKYVRAKRAFLESQGRGLAPDANSTLRVTFGQVLNQLKSSDQSLWPAFTTLDQLVEQHVPGQERLRSARQRARSGEDRTPRALRQRGRRCPDRLSGERRHHRRQFGFGRAERTG